MFYVLSVGPAWRLHATGHLSRDVFLALYDPVLKSTEKSPRWLSGLFDAYMTFWYDYRKPLIDLVTEKQNKQ